MSVLFEEEDAYWIEKAADRLQQLTESKEDDGTVTQLEEDDKLVSELRKLVAYFD